jgi:hypothetical protein
MNAAYIMENKYMIDVATLVKERRGPIPPGPLGAVIYLGNKERQYDPLVDQFLTDLHEGTGLNKGDPVLALREWVIKEKSKSHSQIDKQVMFAIVAHVWSAGLQGGDLTVIKPKAILSRPISIFGFDNMRRSGTTADRAVPSREKPHVAQATESRPAAS